MIRNLTADTFASPALKVNAFATATYVPVGISNDRATLYAYKVSTTSTLAQSVDDGASWTDINTTAFTGTTIESVLELDDGEVLVNCKVTGGTPGKIFKSTGWATSHSTATFALVLTGIGGYFDGRWSGHWCSFGNDSIAASTSRVGVVAEYGSQTTVTYASGNADTTDLTKARRVYLTTDYGATWTQIFDLAAKYPNATGLHVHSVAYDAAWDRIWMTWGDTQTNTVGTGFMELLFSDDRGATWQTYATNTGDGAQSTSIGILPDCIILGSDSRPGILRIPRVSYRVMGTPQYPVVLSSGTGAALIANHLHRNRKQTGAPTLLSFQGAGGKLLPIIYYSPDGLLWTELWRDTTKVAGVARNVFGPTLSGAIVAAIAPSSGTPYTLLRATLEDPGSGLLPRKWDITGDGTTTVFTFAHGIGLAPAKLYSWDMRANGGTYTLTADATNITVTFAVAPANAVVVSLDLRYA